MKIWVIAVADLHTKISGERPLRDPILSFSHTFSLKNTRVGDPCPPNRSTSPWIRQWIGHSEIFHSFCLVIILHILTLAQISYRLVVITYVGLNN